MNSQISKSSSSAKGSSTTSSILEEKLPEIRKKPSTKNWPCQYCYLENSTTPFLRFAECHHTVICVTCCEEELFKKAVLENSIPVCPLERCMKPFYTGQDSAYQCFTFKSKELWESKKSIVRKSESRSSHLIPNCSVIDCSGYLIRRQS